MIEGKHINSAFDQDLERIQTQIMTIGGLVEHSIRLSREALVRLDNELAQQVIANDSAIDTLEEEINKTAVGIIAVRQPQAQDLRTVVAIMKISSSLERVGDYSKNIAKRIPAIIKSFPLTPESGSVKRLAKAVQAQIKNSLDAFIQRDAEMAHLVILSDSEIDQMYNSLFREYLTHMMEEPRSITASLHYLFIAKNLERIGDYATTLAEQTIYIVTGELPGEDRPKDDLTPFAGSDL